MKTKLLLITFMAFCLKVNAQLSGNYTVGDEASDYPTIISAVSDAVISGINGPITFQIKAGLYEEGLIQIDSIPGTSKINTVTFTSEDLNADSVIISNDDGVFLLVDAAWMHFENLTISCSTYKKSGIDFQGSSHGLQVMGNKFDLGSSAYGVYRKEQNDTGKVAADTIIISNNTFTGGSSAIYIYNEWGVYSHYIEINNNVITDFNTNGVYVATFGRVYDSQGNWSSYGGGKITGNKIFSNPEAVSPIGLEMQQIQDGLEVSYNELRIIGKRFVYGLLESNNEGTVSKHQKWYNNMVYVSGKNDYYAEDGVSYGLYMANGNYNEYSNNTIIVDPKGGSSYTVYYGNGGTHKHYNNVYLNLGDSLTDLLVRFRETVEPKDIVLASDYNLYYGAGDNFALWKGGDLTSLEQYKDSLGLETSSVFEAKGGFYMAEGEYKYCSELPIGVPLDYVTDDLYGTLRDDQNPKIGAIEYSTLTTPVVSLTADLLTDCGAFETSVSSSGLVGGDYNWYSGNEDLGTNPSSDSYLIEETAYVALDWSMLDCAIKDSIKIEIFAEPSISITGENSFCSGDTTWLKIDSDELLSSINWSEGSTTDSIAIFTESNIEVDVESVNGCKNSTIVAVTEKLAPTPVISESETVLTSSESGDNYAWYLDNSLISESDFQSIDVTTDGLYSVSVTYDNGCVKTSEEFSIIISGTEDLLLSDRVSIYPNPATSHINTKVGQLDIFDVLGNHVLSTESAGKVDLSSLESGVYLVHQNGKRTKLIVE